MTTAKKPNKPITVQRAAATLIQATRYRHDLSTVFRDFVSIVAITLRNAFEPKDEAWQKREKTYLEIVGRYERDVVDQFTECLAMVMLLAKNGYSDHMGELYMALGISSKAWGQFFTPYHISKTMALITMDKTTIEKAIDEKGFVLANEPTCGAGGMVVAMADAMTHAGFNPADHLRVIAQDIDRICVEMTYINCVLHRIPASIVWGNTLLVEQREVIHTPALYIQMSKMSEGHNETTKAA